MKVYVITAGEYSDYEIYGVAVDKTIAQQIANRVSKFYEEEANIEEYDTDSWMEIIATGNMYEVIKRVRAGGRLDVYETKYAIDSSYKDRNKVKKLYRNRDIMVTVVARNEEHARKIAADLFAEYEYRQAMKEPK